MVNKQASNTPGGEPSHEWTRRGFVVMAAAGVTSIAASVPAVAQPQAGSTANSAPEAGASLLQVTRHTPQLWRITVRNPPFNLVVPELVSALHALVLELERDPSLRVVVFDSMVEGYFINHFDLAKAKDFPVLPGTPAVPAWTDLVLRLSRLPVISMASVRGRTRGGGNEFALACDLRYASIEKAFFGQPEVGTGILPGGGASERLPRLAGRDCAHEFILSSQDYGGADAERLGMVTRALPDAELDAFVYALSPAAGQLRQTGSVRRQGTGQSRHAATRRRLARRLRRIQPVAGLAGFRRSGPAWGNLLPSTAPLSWSVAWGITSVNPSS